MIFYVIFADFIDEIGYFDMYFEWKCGYYRKRLREDFMILGRKLERSQVRLVLIRLFVGEVVRK